MKLIHLSDLHIGKKVNGCSMLDDQKFILLQILNIIDEVKPDGVIIAGDIYDKGIPPSEAVALFDDFLCKLAQRNKPVFIISGNHDSAERLSFGSRIMSKNNIHISPVFKGKVSSITYSDEFGAVNFYLLPFIKPTDVRRRFVDMKLDSSLSYSDAVKIAVDNMEIDPSQRNVIISHQFVIGAEKSDSEEPCSVGGSDEVSSDVYDIFDYAALGHIHGPQSIGKENIRYCGTPLKYSFSEEYHKKSVTVVELKEKGNVTIETIDLNPKRDMRTIEGNFKDLYDVKNQTDDYVQINLTDDEPTPNALRRLREIYPNIMKLKNGKHAGEYSLTAIEEDKQVQDSPLEIVIEFLNDRGVALTDERIEYLDRIINDIWEGKYETD